jgi:hypothetical protein
LRFREQELFKISKIVLAVRTDVRGYNPKTDAASAVLGLLI